MTEMKTEWVFGDAKSVAVFTSRSIIDRREWIYYVSHDMEDGAWQFHPYSGPASEDEAVVCALSEIFEIDHSIGSLSDLPLGWCAWRKDQNAPWIRQKI